MSGKYIISQAAEEDLEAVVRLYVNSWKSTYPGLVPAWYLAGLNDADAERNWRQYISRHNQFILVARLPCGNIAGMIAAQATWEIVNTAYIAALHVEKNFRGLGIGKELIKAAARKFVAQGISRLALAVIEGNDNAMAVYRRLGAQKLDYRLHHEGFTATEYVLLWPDVRLLISDYAD